MSARTPYKRPAKTENVTEAQLSRLQKDVDKVNNEIDSIRRKIDKHLQQQRDYENLKREDEEKLKRVEYIRNILNKYRKEIGMPDSSQQLTITSQKTSATPTSSTKKGSPKSKRNSIIDPDLIQNKDLNSIVDFTMYKFEKKRADINDLNEEISNLQELLRSLQSQAVKTKQIIQNLNLTIPELKTDVSKLSFDKIFDQTILNKKLYKKIYSIDYYTDDINERKQIISQLKNEIQSLQPQQPSIKLIRHPTKDSVISINPSSKMARCASYEDKMIRKGMKKLNPILQKAKTNRINNVSISMKEVTQRINIEYKRLNQLLVKSHKKLPTLQTLKPSDNSQQIKDKFKQIAELKEKIKSNTEMLKNIQTDIPKLRATSPEGLIKWRNDLLNQIKIESSRYENDIQTTKRNLENLKLISSRRINSLQKSIEEKYGK